MDVCELLALPPGGEQLFFYTRLSHPEEAVLAIASAISGAPNAVDLPRSVLVARAQPRPLLALFGEFDAIDMARILALREELAFALRHTRYLDWRAVEDAVVVLGERLAHRIGFEELRRARFVAIPRGGSIVLGLLAYALNLSAAQFAPAGDPAELVVVVDDCSLTGVRFRTALASLPARRVVFAPLCASPALASAVEAAEPRVQACVWAVELQDFAGEHAGESVDAWREWWSQQKNGLTYWSGMSEAVGFPWSEPESSVWVPELARVESGWAFLPPHLCFRHRVTPPSSTGVQVQLASPGPGPLRPADGVVWGRVDDAVAVADLAKPASDASPSGRGCPCLKLDGSGADMWEALVELGDVDAATERLLPLYDVDEAVLQQDLARFVSELQDRGILIRKT